jgi:hypothetical protein
MDMGDDTVKTESNTRSRSDIHARLEVMMNTVFLLQWHVTELMAFSLSDP